MLVDSAALGRSSPQREANACSSDAVDNVRQGLRLTGTHYGTYHARYGERIKEWTGADLAVSLKERVQRPRLDGRHQAQSR